MQGVIPWLAQEAVFTVLKRLKEAIQNNIPELKWVWLKLQELWKIALLYFKRKDTETNLAQLALIMDNHFETVTDIALRMGASRRIITVDSLE